MQRIQDDAVDVLIDLSGHTFGSRPQLLSSRCAPLQLTYLGYLFDTGLAGCDGVIGDAATLPEGSHSARRPLRLPGSFLCYLPPAQTPPVVERAAGAAPIFGSFNHLAKLSPQTVALWSRVVNVVPHSRLVLCALGLADAGVRDRIRARFAASGLEPERLELRPPNTDPVSFLAQYGDIDIALDPLPFNGGTTTLQALWQGVPVISCPGERMAARSGLSILDTAGLSRLIAADHDQFVAIASALASDFAWRQELRQTLRQTLGDVGLTDARRFAQAFAGLLEATAAGI
jgi:predicted O-linked N-acetylglucosamine transferase (SPINDLY family)